jgi:O-antigen/teichoic acid export membrane protein
MPITNTVPIEDARLLKIIIGSVFWATSIIGYTLLILVYSKRNKRKRRRSFLLANRITIIADIMFLMGIVGFVVLTILDMTSVYLAYVAIFIIALSWNIHWLFSRNYLSSLKRNIGGKNK